METNKPIASDEIDLMDLTKRGVRVFLQNKRAFAWIMILCLGTAVFLRFSLKKTYEARMIVRSDILTEPFSNNIAESVNDLIETKSIDALKNKLPLTDKQVNALREIKIESLEEEKTTIEEKDERKLAFFLVTVKVHDNSILPELQEALIKYIENNEYVKIRVEQRKEYYRQAITKVDREIKALDSLKARITKGQAFTSAGSNIVFFDPTNVYNRSIELFKEKIGLEQSLQLANSIQLIEGFGIPNRPIAPRLSVLLPAGLGAGIVLFIFYLAIRGLIWLGKQES